MYLEDMKQEDSVNLEAEKNSLAIYQVSLFEGIFKKIKRKLCAILQDFELVLSAK